MKLFLYINFGSFYYVVLKSFICIYVQFYVYHSFLVSLSRIFSFFRLPQYGTFVWHGMHPYFLSVSRNSFFPFLQLPLFIIPLVSFISLANNLITMCNSDIVSSIPGSKKVTLYIYPYNIIFPPYHKFEITPIFFYFL